MTKYNIEFDLGQIVYLKMDNEQNERMVTGINLRPNQSVIYYLSFGDAETCHYGIEINDKIDILKLTR